jgi:ABC-type polar amino acid transport system ATPase subunit
MDQGMIVEEASPSVFFESAKSDRARQFLSQILAH